MKIAAIPIAKSSRSVIKSEKQSPLMLIVFMRPLPNVQDQLPARSGPGRLSE